MSNAINDLIFADSWGNVSSEKRNELVFESRNKEYGAYLVRKKYSNSVIAACIVAISAFVLAVSAPTILRWLLPEEVVPVARMKETNINELAPPPAMEEVPPPPNIKLPDLKQVVFTPPVIVEHEVTDSIPTIADLKITPIGGDNPGGNDSNITITEPTTTPVDDGSGQEFMIVEKMPQFVGGTEALQRFIQKNVIYPQISKDAGIQGKVVLSFAVLPSGEIEKESIKILLHLSDDCDEEAIRVVKKMPMWEPGMQNGKAVKVRFNLPINFELQ